MNNINILQIHREQVPWKSERLRPGQFMIKHIGDYCFWISRCTDADVADELVLPNLHYYAMVMSDEATIVEYDAAHETLAIAKRKLAEFYKFQHELDGLKYEKL